MAAELSADLPESGVCGGACLFDQPEAEQGADGGDFCAARFPAGGKAVS
ncbi:hypothetical protein [Streptomyces sp. NPDC001568]